MNTEALHILLADDDDDDRLFFKDAINELKVKTKVTLVNDGAQLMDYLNNVEVKVPNVIFLDLNMPIKGGMQCLNEIRSNSKFNEISIAIYSTSASDEDIEETFVKGANIYIKKPNEFAELKRVLSSVISLNWQYYTSGLNKQNFMFSI